MDDSVHMTLHEQNNIKHWKIHSLRKELNMIKTWPNVWYSLQSSIPTPQWRETWPEKFYHFEKCSFFWPVVVGPGAAPQSIIVLLNASSTFYRLRVFKVSPAAATGFQQRAVGKEKGKDAGLSSPWAALNITGIIVRTLNSLHTQKLNQSLTRECSLP